MALAASAITCQVVGVSPIFSPKKVSGMFLPRAMGIPSVDGKKAPASRTFAGLVKSSANRAGTIFLKALRACHSFGILIRVHRKVLFLSGPSAKGACFSDLESPIRLIFPQYTH